MLRLIYTISLCSMTRNQKRDHEERAEIVAFPSIPFQQVLFMGEWSCLSITKQYFSLKPPLPVRQNDETVPSKDEFKGTWNGLKWTWPQRQWAHDFSNQGRKAWVEIPTIMDHLLRCCAARRCWIKEQKAEPGEGGWDTGKALTWGRGAQWVWLIALANTMAQRRSSQ